MADLFKKKTPAEEAPVVADANAEAPAPEVKGKKDKKSKVKYLEPNQMNFLEQYQIVVEGKKKNLDLQKILKPLIAVLIVVLAIFVLLEVVILGMKARNKSLDKYINDPENVASYSEAISTKEEIEQVNAQKANIEACLEAIDSYPNVNAKFFETISNTATNNGVTVSSYAYTTSSGYLTISCAAKDTKGITNFVRAIESKDVGLFDNVNYTGFTGSAASGYSFTLNMTCLGDVNAVAPEVDANAQTEAETAVEEVTEG